MTTWLGEYRHDIIILASCVYVFPNFNRVLCGESDKTHAYYQNSEEKGQNPHGFGCVFD